MFFNGRLGLYRFRFVNQRIDDKGLAALLYLLADKAVGRVPAVRPQPASLNLLAARREFVNGGDVQIAIEGQRQGSRYRGRRHDQDVRVFHPFLTQGRALHDAESVLLVHHRQGQLGDFHPRLNQRMSTHQQVQIALKG